MAEFDLKEFDRFGDKTSQGYDVIERYRVTRAPHGEVAIVQRPPKKYFPGDYVVAWGYDAYDGTWAQGHYDFDTLDEARKYVEDEYKGARRMASARRNAQSLRGVPRRPMMKRRNAAANADEARKLIHDLMVKHFYVKDEGDTVVYESDYIYDYKMPLETAYDIVLEKDPWQAFNDVIFDDANYDDWYVYNIDYLEKEIERYAEQDGVDLDRDEINEYIQDVVFIETEESDMNNLYRQEFPCRLMLDTGDSNTDFTENPSYADFGREGYTMPQEASLRWLCEQLGVDVNVINEHIADGSYDGLNDVEKSIVEEVANTSGTINTVTFVVRCALEQLINWTVQKTDVVIPKGTWCGLFDPYNGGGSIFEIVINQPITIPANIIYELVPDATGYGEYGVIDVYGMSESVGKRIDLETSANKKASVVRRNRR